MLGPAVRGVLAAAVPGCESDSQPRRGRAGHALVENVRRGHYELAVEELVGRGVAVAFDELALAV
jgi:hypothetical protein